MLALVAAIAIALGGVAYFAAERFEQRDRERERALAESALRAELGEMASQARDRAWWNEAIEKLYQAPDAFWADDSIGSYLHHDFEIGVAAVVHPDGSRGFTFLDGEDRTDTEISPVWTDLFAKFHAAANKAGMAEPEPVAHYVRGDGELFVLSAAALTHENPTPEQLEPRVRPTLILGRSLSGPFRVEVAEHYLLEGARAVFELLPDAGKAGVESVPIAGMSGETIGHVVWKLDPGAGLFKEELSITVLLAFVTLLVVGALFGLYLLQTNRMAKATSAALGEERRLLNERTHLLTTIAHDLKTPLTAMQSAVDLLLHFGGKLDDEEKRTELQMIQERILMMDGVISEALQLGRDGVHDYRPSMMDPAESIRELWVRQLPDAERALELTDVRAERRDEMIDRSLFDQAVGNVLSNALKYGDASTPVRVRLSRDGRLLTVMVANLGRGVPEAEIGRLTETFFRASNSGTITGVGLGLSIASRATQQHGGQLDISGVEGDGLKVTMQFDVSGELK